MKDEERTLAVPTEDDENVGDLPKKKIKKKKTKEERSADRKIVFWTLLFVLGVTIFFWIWPFVSGGKIELPKFNKNVQEENSLRPAKKNYIEYKL